MEKVQLKKKTGEDVVPVTAEPPQAFIDMWEEACKIGSKTYGKFNREAKYFELNGITDITYKEALAIYDMKWPFVAPTQFAQNQGYTTRPAVKYPVRTLFPLVADRVQALWPFFSWIGSTGKLTLVVESPSYNTGLYVLNMTQAFQGNRNLVAIKGKINISSCTSFNGTFENCGNLEEFDFYGLKANIDATAILSKVSHNSLNLLVSQALNTAPINVTVHADIYKALTGGAEYPFNGGSREQWEALMSEAIGKQIAFVSA